MKNLPEGIQKFKTIEDIIFHEMCKVACNIIEEHLQTLDNQVMAQRDTKEYRIVRFGKTTIKTRMGEVTFNRRCYKKKTGGYVFLLDEAIGISDQCGLVSENLMEELVRECTEKSFRKASKSISSLTGQNISAMGAWNVFQEYAQRIDKQEQRLKELKKTDKQDRTGKIACPVLFEELDDVWIPMQKEKRNKHNGSIDDKSKKTGDKPLHTGTAYTAWSQTDDRKYHIVDKLAYACFGDIKQFNDIFGMLKNIRYDMDGIVRHIINGDGASWIRSVAEQSDAILQLDPYHRNQAITKAIKDKHDRKAIYEALGEKDASKALEIIYSLITTEKDETTLKNLGELYDYFSNNKDILLNWKERGIEYPAAPEGMQYRNLGVQESSNCNILTQRMKHRKASWSVNGGNHMAKILCFKHTIGLDAITELIPNSSETESLSDPSSSAKTPNYDGKGYGGDWLHANIPFKDVITTNGRKVIQSLLRQKGISELKYT